jgi:hypothetical protein
VADFGECLEAVRKSALSRTVLSLGARWCIRIHNDLTRVVF